MPGQAGVMRASGGSSLDAPVTPMLGSACSGATSRSITCSSPSTASSSTNTSSGALVRATVERQLSNLDVQVVITTGGTGITSRDSTFEAVDALLEKRLDGFGELFRMLSYQQIGAAAMIAPWLSTWLRAVRMLRR